MKLSRFLAIVSVFMMATNAMAQQTPTPVFVSQIKKVEFIDEVQALGTLQANENVDLSSTVTERIKTVNFSDNQRVSKGDLLVEMESAEELAQLAEEQYRMELAKLQLDRTRELVSRQAQTQAELDQRELELETAKARIAAIQSRIEERRVVAPFDGVVGIRNISIGALVQPGTLITTIDDDSVMKLDFSVPEIFLSTFGVGVEVEAKASAYAGQVFKGTVTSVDSRVDSVTRAVAARAIIDNKDRLLKAGMLMTLELRKSPRQTIVIPEESLVTIGTQNFVFVADEQGEKTIAKRQNIELGSRRKGEIEILAGLTEGMKVITHGTVRVRDGAEIEVRAIETGDESLVDLLNQNAQDKI
ncbi:MAG: efflux RND transporter periplasmic adaptor subunit [Pseudomonadota bacterium]